jgi:hypothetical protein
LRRRNSSPSPFLWVLPVATSLDNLVAPGTMSFGSIGIAAVMSGLLSILGFSAAAWFVAARSESMQRLVSSGALLLAIVSLVLLGD